MNLPFRPIDKWPEGWDPAKPIYTTSPFSATYSSTLEVLDREFWMLHAYEAALMVDANASGVRRDGQLAANASVRYPGVILRFDTKKHGVLTYPCNRFNNWRDNVRAIALGLEALRKIERYGIAERGQQYAGFAQIGGGIAMGAASAPMTEDEALRILYEGAGGGIDGERISSPDTVRGVYRLAAAKHHPDKGGDPEVFRKITEARDLLLGASV